jgi:hypothetical protein
MKKIKKLILPLLALAVFLLSLSYENTLAGSMQTAPGKINKIQASTGSSEAELLRDGRKEKLAINTITEILPGDTVNTPQTGGIELQYAGDGLIRMAPGSSLQLLTADEEGYVVKLVQGKIWVNHLLSDTVLNMIAGGAYLIPDHATLSATAEKGKTTVYAHKRNVTVELIPLDYSTFKVNAFESKDFINSYLLTQGNQTTVFDEKISKDATTLKKLLYSKLLKEVQYGLVDPSEVQEDPWIQQNAMADQEFLQKISAARLANIRNHGLKMPALNSGSHHLLQALDSATSELTFASQKANARLLANLFDYFADSEYLIIFGRSTEANDRLSYFKRIAQENIDPRQQDFQQNYLQLLRKKYAELGFISASDPLSLAKDTLFEQILGRLGSSDEAFPEKFLLIRNFLSDAYNLVEDNPQLARVSLERYFEELNKLLSQEKTRLALVKTFLAADIQILNNLFRQYPEFYKDTFFAMKNRLEQTWLALIPEGEQKNEEKQTIVSNKIDFLRALKDFFLASRVEIENARQIVFRLFRETDDLQLPPDAQFAVSDLFARKLEDFGVFYRYLNSPEYSATNLHGSSRQEQFQEFLKAQQERVSINEVRNEILNGNTGSTASPTGTVKRPRVPTPQPSPAPKPSDSTAQVQRAAKILLFQKLKANGITAGENNITVVDVTQNHYQITNASLSSHSNIHFSFTFKGKEPLITDLVIHTETADIKPEGTFEFKNLAEKILSLQG